MERDGLYPFEEIQKIEELALALSMDYKICWFLGAGISKIAGYPLWRELANNMVQYFQENKRKIKDIEKLKIFYELIIERKEKIEDDPIGTLTILKICDKDLFDSGIQEIFSVCENEQDNRIFNIISRFIYRDRNSVIITTNIDRGLQDYMKLSDDRITILGTNPIERSEEPKIIYLHGRIDYPDTWVFTEHDYAEAYGEPEYVKEFLTGFLQDIDVLILLGYSLNEPDVYRIFFKDEIKSKVSIYWIEGHREDNDYHLKRQSSILRNEGVKIKLIPFKVIDNDYRYLFELLEELYDEAYGTEML